VDRRAHRPPSWLGTLVVVIAAIVIALSAASRMRRAVRSVPADDVAPRAP
jgi:hypothetical protein